MKRSLYGNAKGKLTSLTDPAGSAAYSYDSLGRITTEQRTIAGVSKTVSYDYNLDGSLKVLHYPSGAAVTYTPDSAGRILSAIDSGNSINYVTGATYGPDSALTGFVSGNTGGFAGISNAFSYNKRLQPVFMSAAAPSQTVFSIGYDFHVGAGNNGNVYGITNYKETTRNQSFTYDALNRLASAQNAGTNCAATTVNGKTEYWGNNYGYDAWGNLLQKMVTKCNAENLSITALANNQLSGYGYDAAGNMTSDPTDGVTSVYDAENRIATATKNAVTTTYTYDSDGNRVKKSSGSTGMLYWYMSPGIVGESDLSGGERVARKDFPGNAVSYYFSDHLKTASVITDSAGNIKSESDYYPWGGELQFVNNDSNHYKYGGHERDNESGLDYYGARYYGSALGRFLTPDWAENATAVPYADFGNPQSLNLYSYTKNNPTTFGDADGHCDAKGQNCSLWDHIAGAVAGVLNIVPATANLPVQLVNAVVGPVGGHPLFDEFPMIQPDAHASVGGMQVGATLSVAIPVAGEASFLIKGAEVTEVAASANLATRASEIHSALDPIAQEMRTTAVANVTNADGTVSTLVSSSKNTLAPAQRALLQPGETAVKGAGHAEETILNAAKQNGQTVNTMGVSRTICPTCAPKLQEAGVDAKGPN